jgi:heterodisulfide reductase subunit A-like polyferredoxin
MARTPSIPATNKTTAKAQATISTQRVAQITGHLAPGEETEHAKTRPVLSIQYPVSKLQLDAGRCIDHGRKLKVAVIGAGLAGINAGILLPAKVPGIELTIFEKNNDVASMSLKFVKRTLMRRTERHMAREYL